MNVVIATGPALRARPDALVIDLASCALRRGERVAFFRGDRNFRFVTLMATVRGIVSYAEMEEACWGDEEDGGPDDSRKCLFAMRYMTAKRLLALGLKINTSWWRGFELVELEDARLAA